MRTALPLRSVALCAVVLSTAACPSRPFLLDEAPIANRYSHQFSGQTCASWLRSQRTGFMYCASPDVEVDVSVYRGPVQLHAKVEPTETDLASLMSYGEEVYGQVCVTCHQADGAGTPGIYPPLAGSGEFYGDPQNHARIIVHGLEGPIVVQGQEWDRVMPPQGSTLSDYAVAAAATYVRHSWGNNDGIVLPDDVAAVR